MLLSLLLLVVKGLKYCRGKEVTRITLTSMGLETAFCHYRNSKIFMHKLLTKKCRLFYPIYDACASPEVLYELPKSQKPESIVWSRPVTHVAWRPQ